jgi:hypothetical protein
MLNVKHAVALSTVILSALLAPAAVAMPVDPPISSAPAAPQVAAAPALPQPSSTEIAPGDGEFHWDDAAIGAAAMLAALGIGAALLIGSRHARERDRTVVVS